LFLSNVFATLLATPSEGGVGAFDVKGKSIYNEPLFPPRRRCKMQELVLGVSFTRMLAKKQKTRTWPSSFIDFMKAFIKHVIF
jgi:hypothetical protein